MDKHDYTEFSRLLDDAYDLIGVGQNKVISGGAKSMFFRAMEPYNIEVFQAALNAHCMHKERGRFTPKPADIVEQIEAMLSRDGRPGAEEAWAMALQAQDEADTVVWTTETAEAMNIARPVLNASGAISARKTFIEAYERIVLISRKAHKNIQWVPSLGWDLSRRETALKAAANAGLLPAPEVAALLPPPMGAAKNDVKAQEQLQGIREMMARMNEEKRLAQELHEKREREAVAARKKELMDMAQKRLDEDLAKERAA